MKSAFVPVVLGTARKDNRTAPVAKLMVRELKKLGVKTQLIDVAKLATLATTMDAKDAKVKRWRKIVDEASGFIIVSPEYNYGYPGELKILLDKAYAHYQGKALGICSVSSGEGGLRMIDQLRFIAFKYGFFSIRPTLSFRGMKEPGAMEREIAKNKEAMQVFFRELLAAASKQSSQKPAKKG